MFILRIFIALLSLACIVGPLTCPDMSENTNMIALGLFVFFLILQRVFIPKLTAKTFLSLAFPLGWLLFELLTATVKPLDHYYLVILILCFALIFKFFDNKLWKKIELVLYGE